MATIFIKSATKVSDLPTDEKPQIALVGRSNVGKSSLINKLTGQKCLARESAEPGCTKTINVFQVDKNYYLIDLPGYGFAKASKDKRQSFSNMISDYLQYTPQLKLILLIIDARRGLTELDRDMIDYLESVQIPFVLIINKIDKLSKTETAKIFKTLNSDCQGISLFPHSSVTGIGRGEIKEAINEVIRNEKK